MTEQLEAQQARRLLKDILDAVLGQQADAMIEEYGWEQVSWFACQFAKDVMRPAAKKS